MHRSERILRVFDDVTIRTEDFCDVSIAQREDSTEKDEIGWQEAASEGYCQLTNKRRGEGERGRGGEGERGRGGEGERGRRAKKRKEEGRS